MTKLPQIQAKIREVCPELAYTHPEGRVTYWPTELPHVLRAIGETSFYVEMDLYDGKLRFTNYSDVEGTDDEVISITWNLTKSLADQDEPTINLLHSILCHE